MRHAVVLFFGASLLTPTIAHAAAAPDSPASLTAASAAEADVPGKTPHAEKAASRGDLFPTPWRPSVAAATGLPFLGIGEVGVGVTKGFAVGVVGGITPSVLTAGVRPRFRVATSERTALVLNVPMLYYPKASAPGPGNIGNSQWVLTRPELFFEGALGERWHVAGGMGVVAAGSTEAIGNWMNGRDFTMPAYSGSKEARTGFAGGIWNTVAARSSVLVFEDTHVFAEASLVLRGVKPADNVGGPPIVANLGVQHTF